MFIAVFIGVAFAGLVGAVEDLTFEVQSIDGAGWRAEGVAVHWNLPERSAVTATVARLKLTAQKQEFRNLRVECPAIEISVATIACPHARIVGTLPQLGAQNLSGRVTYGRTNGTLDLRLDGLRLGAGKMSIAATLEPEGWHARLNLDRVAIETLLKLAQQMQLPLAQLSGSGAVSGSMTASGFSSSIRRAHIDAALTDLTVSNTEGTLATDKLAFNVRADMAQAPGGWTFSAELKSSQGQAYAQPIFLDLGLHAIDLSGRGTWHKDGPLTIDHFSVDHRDVARGEGRGVLRLDQEQPIRSLQLTLKALQFPGAYETYFQPLLLETNFKSLRTAGAISGELTVADGMPRSVNLALSGVTLDDGSRNFVVRGLAGNVHWVDQAGSDASADTDDDDEHEAPQGRDSMLHWQSATLLNLEVGGSELHFNTRGRQARLLHPAGIPLLDGAINLESFRIRNAGLESVAFMVDATMQPISVQKLCHAFGWPEFGGQISGTISKLRMRDGLVTVGTKLEAQVFDGVVRISDLRMEQPFSQWPRLHANIALDNLDLDLITSAFSFGSITGRLSGTINGLELFNWQPVAFDARLYTPPNDRSRRRISQRAVENIGSIGGGSAGVTAALSSGAMRFFDDFNYDRLGISCRLENEVCHMEGIAPAPNGGYYLVKGKGLPRIDVIGGARQVDWPRLVKQLIAVTESAGPVVD